MKNSKKTKQKIKSQITSFLLVSLLVPTSVVAAQVCKEVHLSTENKAPLANHDTEFQELLRPKYKMNKENATIDLEWSHIDREISQRMNIQKTDVTLLVDGVESRPISPGQTTAHLQFSTPGQQHDVVVQFRDPKTQALIHETYPILLESQKSQTVKPDSFRKQAQEAPLNISLPKSFTRQSKINEGLVKRTVELGYQKIVWTLTDQASPSVRIIANRYGNQLQVVAELDASGRPLNYVLRSPTGENLGEATPKEIRIQNDAAFNGNAFFWDNEFVSLASNLHHPSLTESTMDFHYDSQKKMKNGVIPREVRHSNGVSYHRYEEVQFGHKRQNDEFINPNFTGWVELNLHALAKPSVSKARLKKAIQSMEQYTSWVETTRSVSDQNGEFVGFWTSNLGSGADNSPRGGSNRNKENFHKIGWVDLLAQQISLYKDMAEMHAVLGEWTQAQAKQSRALQLQKLLNDRYWNAEQGFYFDLILKDGRYVQDVATPTQSSFWAYVARAANSQQVKSTINKQLTPDRFGGPFPGASLASAHPEFVEQGGYWRGGRWPPTGVMMAQGFENSGRWDVSFQIARDFWSAMSEVSRDHKAKTGQDSVFEFYGVQTQSDGTLKPIVGVQTGHTTRADFTGWGKTPITYTGIRNVFGLRPVGSYLGARETSNNWIEWLKTSNETAIASFPQILENNSQREKILGGFIEWNLNFDFEAGESLHLENFVYQGNPVEVLKITKIRENVYRLEVKSRSSFNLQILRRFLHSGDTSPQAQPVLATEILTIGGGNATTALEINLNVAPK